jgi:membrane-bound lytic murein transglycosylase B
MEKQAVRGQILILAEATKTRKNQDLTPNTMRWLALLTAFALLTAPRVATQTTTPDQTVPSVLATGISVPSVAVDAPKSFDEWLADLRTEARSKGFSDGLIEETLTGLAPLERVIQSDRSQAELNPGFSRYSNARITRSMITRGKALLAEHNVLLRRTEREFGIPSRVLVAFWGMESRFGRIQGSTPVFQALATLAWEPRRATYFRNELFNAMTMVQRGHIEAGTMTGSWAGAMGQTQFMPSSYLAYAVDFDGDQRRDIWKSTPDTLASMANYLKGFGWKSDETWGREVKINADAARAIATIPKRTDGCYAQRNMTERRPLAQWQNLGVRRIDGGALPKADIEAGLVDVGERKFLVYPNYDAIIAYNCAHYYALTVGLLADRLK